MKTNNLFYRDNRIFKAAVAIAVAGGLFVASLVAQAQTTAANLSPDLQEIVKFAQAHMSDDVILAYIKNTGKSYTLSADDMLYLNSQGVSQPVISALLQAKAAPNSAPTAAVPAPAPAAPSAAPLPPTVGPGPAPVSALFDNFNTDAGLNRGAWTVQSPLLANLAALYGSPLIQPALGFTPTGLQMSGVNGPGQFTGIQSVGSFGAPFSLTATVTGQSQAGVPFALYLVSGDRRQWISLTGHLGGEGHREGEVHVGGVFGIFRGGANIPLGGGPSPDHGVWVNYTGSGMSPAALGQKIFENPHAGVPYNIQITVGADGMASVALMDLAGVTLGAGSGLAAGDGPFYVVLAERNGPTFADWTSLQLTPLGPPPSPAVAPATPTMDYFQGQLAPYGHWMEVEGVGSCWVPAEASIPGWRPYLDNGHWEYTDAGWYWQSGYPWGEITFHYGRWLRDERTGFTWAWAPGYDWAPSWVSWRYSDADGCLGWAPLPWDARFDPRLGIVFHGNVAVDMDFGMGPDFYVFVGSDHFWVNDYHAYVFAPDRARFFYAHSEIRNGFRTEHGHLVAKGMGRERMAQFTHHEVVAHNAHELRQSEEHHNLEVRRVAMREDHGRAEQGHSDAGREGRSVEPREPGSANYENARGQSEHGQSPSSYGQSRDEPNAYNKSTPAGSKIGQTSSHGNPNSKPKQNEHGN